MTWETYLLSFIRRASFRILALQTKQNLHKRRIYLTLFSTQSKYRKGKRKTRLMKTDIQNNSQQQTIFSINKLGGGEVIFYRFIGSKDKEK